MIEAKGGGLEVRNDMKHVMKVMVSNVTFERVIHFVPHKTKALHLYYQPS